MVCTAEPVHFSHLNRLEGQFVLKPFKSWGKIFQKASAHTKKQYHLSSMTKMSEFLALYENPSQSISTVMDSELQRNMESKSQSG